MAAEIQLGGGRIVVADAGKGLALVALLREGMERRAALQWNVERVKRAVEEIAAVSGR